MLQLLLPERPAESLIRLDAHIAQVARYIDAFFGFDQWFLFNTRWAAAHPDLARSCCMRGSPQGVEGKGSLPWGGSLELSPRMTVGGHGRCAALTAASGRLSTARGRDRR
ncbi:hypothetical protein GCM10023176_34690 [Micromonospora coerulea]|uniref:Uncharacterized protein n=1 Tax=Micromonospora coerulea TaxID=47856 RepID=A0ABP8SMH5_9ACTN